MRNEDEDKYVVQWCWKVGPRDCGARRLARLDPTPHINLLSAPTEMVLEFGLLDCDVRGR